MRNRSLFSIGTVFIMIIACSSETNVTSEVTVSQTLSATQINETFATTMPIEEVAPQWLYVPTNTDPTSDEGRAESTATAIGSITRRKLNYYYLQMVSKNIGWGASHDNDVLPNIYKTTDNWRTTEISKIPDEYVMHTENINHVGAYVSVLDGNTLWYSFGYDNPLSELRIIMTKDGGKNWTKRIIKAGSPYEYGIRRELVSIDIITEDIAYFTISIGDKQYLSAYQTYKTSDSGKTWFLLPMNTYLYNCLYTGVHFTEDDRGWVTIPTDCEQETTIAQFKSHPAIFILNSPDGGLNWGKVAIAPPEELVTSLSDGSVFKYIQHQIFNIDKYGPSTIGFITTFSLSEISVHNNEFIRSGKKEISSYYYISFNSGETWNIIRIEDELTFGKEIAKREKDRDWGKVYFISQNTGWFQMQVDGTTYLWKTINGGKDWTKISEIAGNVDVIFFDEYNGWGWDKVKKEFLYTLDSGITW